MIKLPPPTTEEIKLHREIVAMLRDYFKDDTDKIILWLRTENPNLGGMKPSWMMSVGRSEKLRNFIRGQLDGNFP